MKKRMLIAVLLTLAMTVAFATPVLAGDPWDVEDPCEFSHEDFALASGYDAETQTTVTYKGEHFPGNQPSDGYNIYRDDATDSGDLDVIAIWLPRPSPGFDYTSMSNPDTWYWGTEPRGYNLLSPAPKPAPKPKVDHNRWTSNFDVVVGSWASYHSYKWEGGYLDGKVLGVPVSQVGKSNGDYYRLDIPIGTEVSCNGVRIDGLKLMFYNGTPEFVWGRYAQFSNVCTISKLVDGEWEVIVTFTEIAGGEPK